MNKEQRLEIFKALGEGRVVILTMPDGEHSIIGPETDGYRQIETATGFEIKREPAIYRGIARAIPRLPDHDPLVGLHVSPLHQGLTFHVVATETVDDAPQQPAASSVSLNNNRSRCAKDETWICDVDNCNTPHKLEIVDAIGVVGRYGLPGQKVSIFARPTKE